MRARIYRLSLLLLIFVFLFSLISCSNNQAEATITDLKQQLADCQEKDPTTGEQTTEVTEESKQEEVEVLPEETGKDFSPVIEADLFIQGQTRFTFVLDNYLYASGQGSLNIFDITNNKSNPNPVGATSGDWVNETYLYVEDDYAYIAYLQWNETGQTSGVKVIDVANKETPVEVAKLEMDKNISDVAVLDNYIFISYNIYGQQESESGIEIIDITDKANPVSIDNVAVRKYGGGPFCIAEESGYFLDSGNLKILNLKDITNIDIIKNYPLSIYVNDIQVNDNYLYFTTGNTLQIIDLSDNDLEIIGGVFGRGGVQGIAIKEDYACLSYVIRDSNDENWVIKESGLQIIDLSNKEQPSIVARINIPGEAAGIFIEDNYAYVAAGQNGVQIVKLFDE